MQFCRLGVMQARHEMMRHGTAKPRSTACIIQDEPLEAQAPQPPLPSLGVPANQRALA